jgi:hypothetical protein
MVTQVQEVARGMRSINKIFTRMERRRETTMSTYMDLGWWTINNNHNLILITISKTTLVMVIGFHWLIIREDKFMTDFINSSKVREKEHIRISWGNHQPYILIFIKIAMSLIQFSVSSHLIIIILYINKELRDWRMMKKFLTIINNYDDIDRYT